MTEKWYQLRTKKFNSFFPLSFARPPEAISVSQQTPHFEVCSIDLIPLLLSLSKVVWVWRLFEMQFMLITMFGVQLPVTVIESTTTSRTIRSDIVIWIFFFGFCRSLKIYENIYLVFDQIKKSLKYF